MYIVFSPRRSCAAFFLSRASFAFSLFSLLPPHRMCVPFRTVDTNIYRARIGNFHTRAAALGRKLAFLDQSALILISSNCSDRLVFATFVHFCLRYTFSTQDLPLRLAYKTKPNSCNKSGSLDDHPAKQNRMFFNLYKTRLLFISGDVERNPGPPLEKGLCVVHVNAGSLGKKLDLLEAESEHFDIITLSTMRTDDAPWKTRNSIINKATW